MGPGDTRPGNTEEKIPELPSLPFSPRVYGVVVGEGAGIAPLVTAHMEAEEVTVIL